jgi:hypothetical protein
VFCQDFFGTASRTSSNGGRLERWSVTVPEIEPFLPPALDRISHWKVEVLDFFPNDEANPANHMRTFTSTVALDIQNLPPKTPLGVNAEEDLAYSDENGKVKDGVWGQLPKLYPIGEKQATKELVGWKKKPTVQKNR